MNHIRPWRNIDRRKSRQIHVGSGYRLVATRRSAVQTMTNTLTTDANGNDSNRSIRCADAGADIVRVSVPDPGQCPPR